MTSPFSPLPTLSTLRQQKRRAIAARATAIRQLLLTAGIHPDKVTLSALLLVVMEAAELSRVPLAQVVATMHAVDQAADPYDDDGEDTDGGAGCLVN